VRKQGCSKISQILCERLYTSPPGRVSPLAPPRSSPHALAGRGYSMPRRTGRSLAPEAENRSASAPCRISTHTAAMFHDSTAVVPNACASLLAGWRGVHGKGASPRLAGIAGLARPCCASSAHLFTPRSAQEVRHMLRPFDMSRSRARPFLSRGADLSAMQGRAAGLRISATARAETKLSTVG